MENHRQFTNLRVDEKKQTKGLTTKRERRTFFETKKINAMVHKFQAGDTMK
jgi:hypothetical protein